MQVDMDNEIRLRKERVLTLKNEIKQLEETRSMLMGSSQVPEGEAPEKDSPDDK